MLTRILHAPAHHRVNKKSAVLGLVSWPAATILGVGRVGKGLDTGNVEY